MTFSITIADTRDQEARDRHAAHKRGTNRKRHAKGSGGGTANDNPDMRPFVWESPNAWDGVSPIHPESGSPDVRAIHAKCRALMHERIEANGSGFPCSGDGCAVMDSRECAPCVLPSPFADASAGPPDTSLLVFPYCGSHRCLAKISAAQQASVAASEPLKLDLLKMILGGHGPDGKKATQEEIMRAAAAMASGNAPMRMTPSLPSGCCASCGARTTLMCKRCGTRFYCSKPCQASAWPSHRAECAPRAM
jgi:hypothetical protein